MEQDSEPDPEKVTHSILQSAHQVRPYSRGNMDSKVKAGSLG